MKKTEEPPPASGIAKVTKQFRNFFPVPSYPKSLFSLPPFTLPLLKRLEEQVDETPLPFSNPSKESEQIPIQAQSQIQTTTQEKKYASSASKNPSLNYEQENPYNNSLPGKIIQFFKKLEGIVFESAGNSFVFSTFEKGKGLKKEKYMIDPAVKLLAGRASQSGFSNPSTKNYKCDDFQGVSANSKSYYSQSV